MIQLPIPEGDTTLVQVSLPEGWEHWRDAYLQDGVEKLLLFLTLALGLYLLARLARRQVSRQIEDVNRRHGIRKGIGYAYAFLLLLLAIALFADSLTGVGTILAVIIAGVAVALQDILKSVVAWMYISSRAGVQVGSRVQVDKVMGDVIDIGVLKTTLIEVGNLVYGFQSTGRLVTVPNFKLLASTVFVSGPYNPFMWQELKFLVTYESDWERAEALLRTIADEAHAEIAPDLERGFRRLERRYAFKYGAVTPIVYVVAADSGVELTLRFLTHVRRRRGGADRITRRVLRAFAAEPGVDLAYPTYRVYRAREGEAREGSGEPG
jgi:small-conductance mechanosensitive channel